jgi:hypothetical protein
MSHKVKEVKKDKSSIVIEIDEDDKKGEKKRS